MLEQFISHIQLELLNELKRTSEEKEFFNALLSELNTRIANMPLPYATKEQSNPKALLHYFYGNCDWYICEKDSSEEQLQAWGYASLGYGYEAGYISIKELISNNVELDLYFNPQPINNLIKQEK